MAAQVIMRHLNWKLLWSKALSCEIYFDGRVAKVVNKIETVEFILIRKTAQIPARATKQGAGFDLYSPDAFTLFAGQRKTVPLGFKIKLPQGHMAEFRDRSGLAHRNGLHVLAGIIDADFRDECGAILLNTGDEPVAVNIGDRIAQMLIRKVEEVELLQVNKFSEEETVLDRLGGFGSSGR